MAGKKKLPVQPPHPAKPGPWHSHPGRAPAQALLIDGDGRSVCHLETLAENDETHRATQALLAESRALYAIVQGSLPMLSEYATPGFLDKALSTLARARGQKA